jgi:catalase-peroxidase
LATVLTALEGVQKTFNSDSESKVSLADLIVLAGTAAIESAAAAAGHKGFSVPFTQGRTDATEEQTAAATFAVLEPVSDGFRNFVGKAPPKSPHTGARPEDVLIDKAYMLGLNKSEMTVLVGGMRVLGATTVGSAVGVFTSAPGTLTNDFFTNLLDMNTEWKPTGEDQSQFEGYDRTSKAVKWTGSRVDLAFGSNSELRALSEYYACDDAKTAFVSDFAAAWVKVMNLDRFDV